MACRLKIVAKREVNDKASYNRTWILCHLSFLCLHLINNRNNLNRGLETNERGTKAVISARDKIVRLNLNYLLSWWRHHIWTNGWANNRDAGDLRCHLSLHKHDITAQDPGRPFLADYDFFTGFSSCHVYQVIGIKWSGLNGHVWVTSIGFFRCYNSLISVQPCMYINNLRPINII